MRHADLTAGRGKLQRTMDAYRSARNQVLAAWNDDVARQFGEQSLDPLEPRFVRAGAGPGPSAGPAPGPRAERAQRAAAGAPIFMRTGLAPQSSSRL